LTQPRRSSFEYLDTEEEQSKADETEGQEKTAAATAAATAATAGSLVSSDLQERLYEELLMRCFVSFIDS